MKNLQDHHGLRNKKKMNEQDLRNKLADLIMENHLLDFSSPKGVSNHCLRGDCDHVEDAMIVRGNNEN